MQLALLVKILTVGVEKTIVFFPAYRRKILFRQNYIRNPPFFLRQNARLKNAVIHLIDYYITISVNIINNYAIFGVVLVYFDFQVAVFAIQGYKHFHDIPFV
jgi:hypothetical protein